MDGMWTTLTAENLQQEHLCCAIGDKKHQAGVEAKKEWLLGRLPEGHVFRKLNAQGKVFIEYAPLETAFVPVEGAGYLYIYCLWVAGAFKGQGYGKALLEHCLADARAQGKAGVCVLSAKKKKPYLSEKKFLQRFGFETVDASGDYELLALSLDGGPRPRFAESAKRQTVPWQELTVYYSPQCPYLRNCVEQVRAYCGAQQIPLRLEAVERVEQAKALPCVFNNWATFYGGRLLGLQPLNENALKKLLQSAAPRPAFKVLHFLQAESKIKKRARSLSALDGSGESGP